MEDQPESPLHMDDTGNLDVARELDTIRRFSELGLPVEGMEDLLFTDIEEYKRKKMALIHQEIHLNEMEQGIVSDDIENKWQTQPEFPPQMGYSQEEGAAPIEEELILLETDLFDEEGITGSAGSDENERKNEECVSEILLENEMEEPIPANDKEEDITPQPEENERGDMPETDTKNKIRIEKKRRNLKGNRKVLIIALTGMVIAILLGIYVLSLMIPPQDQNETKLEPSIIVSDINPFAGQLVNLTAEPNMDELTYRWTITPDYFEIEKGSVDEIHLSVFFTKDGVFNIDITVVNKGNSYSSNVLINVQNTPIILERERFGDISQYQVNGHFKMENIGSFSSSKELAAYSTLESDFWTTPSEPMETVIFSSPVTSTDGFSNSYQHIKRTITQDLKLSGTLRSYSGFISTLTGTTQLEQTTFMDLYTKRPTSFRSDVDYDLSVQAVAGSDFTYTSSETVWTYPSLNVPFSDLRVEDISTERNISQDDTGSTRWGSYALEWIAVEYDRIIDTPSIRLDLSLDTASRERLSIKEFKMSVWIGDSIPEIMRMVLNISSNDNLKNPYDLDYKQEILSYVKGNEPIIFGSLDNKHESIDTISELFQDVGSQFHSDWEYVPRTGTLFSSTPDDFTAEDAISSFEDDLNFKNYKRSRTDPFGLYSNFSRYLNRDQWFFSIGDKGEDRCWNQTVWRDTNPPGLTARIDPVMITREEIGSILTYSGGEVALKRLLSSINQEGAFAIFGVGSVEDSRQIDPSKFSIGTAADMSYPVPGLVDPTLGERIPYALFIESLDGKVQTAVDLTTGQLSFVRLVN